MTEHASVWANNGGIYFGLATTPPGNPERPLEGKEAEASVAPDVTIKTTWCVSACNFDPLNGGIGVQN
jgi:hypothetical protein